MDVSPPPLSGVKETLTPCSLSRFCTISSSNNQKGDPRGTVHTNWATDPCVAFRSVGSLMKPSETME